MIFSSEGKRVAIYARVSKDDGRAEGATSTERQVEDCKKLADLRRYDVVAVEVDQGISAYSKTERPAWQRVLGMVERGEIDVILAWHMDRVTRNMIELERVIHMCVERDVAVATVVGDIDLSNDMGRMIARILAAVANAEVERKAARQKRANQDRRKDGIMWRSGWRAFGYTNDGEVIEAEAELIRQGATDFLKGKPLTHIANDWQASGVKPRNGGDWLSSSVRTILLNPKIAGYMTYQSQISGDGDWQRILERDTFALVTAKLNDPKRTTGGSSRGRKAENLLTGLAECGVCGGTVSGNTTDNKAGQRINVYKCKGRHLVAVREDADNFVRTVLMASVSTMLPGTVLGIPDRGQTADNQVEIEELNARLDELAEAYGRKTITMMQLESATFTINQKLDELASEVDATTDYDPRLLNQEAIKNFLDLDMDAQRAILARVSKITIHPKGRGKRNVPMSEQVSVQVRQTYPHNDAERWVWANKASAMVERGEVAASGE